MNDAYKLLGTFWDHKPEPTQKPIIEYEPEVPIDGVLRLSEILSIVDENLNTDQKYGKKILIDFCPIQYALCVWNFYIHRLLQIKHYLNMDLICNDKKMILLLEERLKKYYERKTP